jgi:hypothetical protein
MSMSNKVTIIVFGLLLCTFWAGCARHTVVATQDLALPSGEHVTISNTHGDSFTDVNGRQRHIYYIAYFTAHDFDDIPSLRQEARRVWAAYKPQIVGIDYDSCVVTPMKQTAGGSDEGRPFYLTRQTDGSWSLTP